jgi:hypothetical protein
MASRSGAASRLIIATKDQQLVVSRTERRKEDRPGATSLAGVGAMVKKKPQNHYEFNSTPRTFHAGNMLKMPQKTH